MRTCLLSTAVVALMATLAQGTASADSGATLIRNVRVFDGERSLGKRTVLIDQGKVVSTDFKGATPAATRILDGEGKTLIPGLIDSHVHAFQALDMPLLFGVTTQLDMFMPVGAAKALKARMLAGTNTDKADLYTA